MTAEATTTNNSSASRPLRASWRDFPPEYVSLLELSEFQPAQAKLGPMSWNDVRFCQREFYRLIAALRKGAAMEGSDRETRKLNKLALRLRVSCPLVDPQRPHKGHWLVLKINPIVAAMEARRKSADRPVPQITVTPICEPPAPILKAYKEQTEQAISNGILPRLFRS